MPKIECHLAAFDLDGTLLNNSFQISGRNCEAIRKLVEKGITVVLVSGRMNATILPFSRQLGLEGPIISYNGALVKHSKTSKVYHHLPVASNLAIRVIDLASRWNLHLNVCLDDSVYVAQKTVWSQLYDSRTGATSIPVGDLHQFEGQAPTKLQTITDPTLTDSWLEKFKNEFRTQLYITKTMAEYIEFMHPEVSKGKALSALAKRFGISKERIVSFGDSYNDETMFKVSGFSIAMGNAVQPLKECADYISSSNDEDGVAEAIEKLLI
jgi:Cof subfamily protein (haloacid dehalogenase superfamily)